MSLRYRLVQEFFCVKPRQSNLEYAILLWKFKIFHILAFSDTRSIFSSSQFSKNSGADHSKNYSHSAVEELMASAS